MTSASATPINGVRRLNSCELFPHLAVPGEAGLPMLLVSNAHARAVIALQGAQVMTFQAAGQREMLWMSPRCVLRAGKAIRGGIPLCLPWFGPGADGKTAHGFARTQEWALLSAELQNDGSTRLELGLSSDTPGHALWPHAFAFRLEIIVGAELTLRLSVENCSQEPAPLSFAFHTYFAVPDVAKVRVQGLDGASCHDKISDARYTQDGPLTLSAHTDRIYFDVPPTQVLESEAGTIAIESDARCAVVWNAWEKSKDIADIGEGQYHGYLCVERGEVAERARVLAAREIYRTWMTLGTGDGA